MGQQHVYARGNGQRPVVVLDIDGTLLEAVGQELMPADQYVLYRPTGRTLGTSAEVVCCSVTSPAEPVQVQAAPSAGKPLPLPLRLWGRPGLPLFLQSLASAADIVVWSMGVDAYVNLVCDKIVRPLLGDMGHCLIGVLHRGHCESSSAQPRYGPYLKNLDFVADTYDRPVHQIILIEDTPSNAPDWQNVIGVPSYRAGAPSAKQDRILFRLLSARRPARQDQDEEPWTARRGQKRTSQDAPKPRPNQQQQHKAVPPPPAHPVRFQVVHSDPSLQEISPPHPGLTAIR